MDPVTKDTPKKQHYVPQFLLRNFAIENTENLFTFDKQNNKIFPASVKNSASENGFYNIEVSENKKLTLEYKLGNLECLASQALSKIRESESVSNINEEEHKILCFFAANLLLRVKRQRVFTSQINAQIAKFTERLGFKSGEIKNFEELSEEEIEIQHIHFLHNELLDFANKFGDKAIGLLRAPDNYSFIISDNPVVMHSRKVDKFNTRPKGVSVPGIEIFLPISKKLCISFLCMDFYYELADGLKIIEENRNKKPEFSLIDISYAKPLLESIQTGEAKTINKSHVEFLNSLQVFDSWSYIYNETNNFDLAKKLIKDNPDINSSNIVKVGI